ncbi:receptor-like serine/threonine-protein kinase SD1-8 [Hibiscus syriacus]|uniref:receptor-like serine/threonine-protein kinase SD1-8 n=1 Tax=Hibiscus syriacus TaxID=106335 RepID=UPI0019225551|nr:receptor-like serine/threonine-protein kinase SD1-8 [Hibiscus syriacus]
MLSCSGFMFPEHAVKGIFSVKSDVFSFGVIVLEMISGKKNTPKLIDICLKDLIIEYQVLRCMQVGLLCVQSFPEDRPTMSSVNFMLANGDLTLPLPKESGFFTDKSLDADIAALNNAELPTINAVTITMLGRR